MMRFGFTLPQTRVTNSDLQDLCCMKHVILAIVTTFTMHSGVRHHDVTKTKIWQSSHSCRSSRTALHLACTLTGAIFGNVTQLVFSRNVNYLVLLYNMKHNK